MRKILLSLALVLASGDALAQGAPRVAPFNEAIAASKSRMMRDPAAALEFATNAVDLAPAQASLETATAKWLQGEALIRMNRPSDARPIIDEALALAERLGPDTKLYGDLLFAKAGCALANGDYATALSSLQTAHDAFLKLGESRARSMALQDIASIYTDARDYPRALHYYEQAGEAYAGDPAIDLTRLNNIGLAYRDMAQYRQAEEGFRSALKIAQEMGSSLLEERILSNIASVQLMAGRTDAAEATVKQGLAVSRPDKAVGWEPFLWGIRAQIEFKRGNAERAAQLIARTFRDQDLSKTVMQFREFHSAAHAIYAATGDNARALQHLTAFKRLDDEARDISAAANTALMSAQFDFTTQELQIANLRSESLQREVDLERARARQRMLVFLAGGVLALVLLAGGIAHYLSMRRSRNQVREANTRLTSSNAALEKALKAKSEFLATTSHEIRTPLNGILGMAQMLIHQKSLAPEVRERVELMHASGEAMKAIVDDILDVAKMETGAVTTELSDFDLPAALNEVARIWSDVASQKGVDVRIEVEGCPTIVRSDPQRIRQVAFNLMSNAVKFTDAGSVTLSAVADHTVNPAVLRICVSDTGCGVPEDQLAAIFEPFHQVDGGKTRRHSGTGLGLSICEKIVQALGGDIAVSSTLGEGSQFRVELPLMEISRAERDDAADGSYKILIVDDNLLHQSLLEGFLEADGVSIEVTDNLEDAVRHAQQMRPQALYLSCACLSLHWTDLMDAMLGLTEAAHGGSRIVQRSSETLIEAPMLRLAGFDTVLEGEFDPAAIAALLLDSKYKLCSAA